MLLTYTSTCSGYVHTDHLINQRSLILKCPLMINQLCIADYPVKAFSGRKKLIISTVSWIGGRNNFLGIAYMVVGVICILLALIFLIIHCKIGKR